MQKSERIKVYEWCQSNQGQSGSKYPRVLQVSQCDYEAIRARIAQKYKYAGYTIVESQRDNKKIQIYIK